MAELYGRTYTRQEILRYVSDVAHLGEVRLHVLDDGSERGVRVAQFRTGSGLAFDVLLDRGMDIGEASHNGRPIGWRSAVGHPHPAYFHAHGIEGFLQAFHGGLLVGCGLENVGSPSEDAGETLPLHGTLSNTPASHVGYGGEWVGDEYRLWVEGQMRQARVFGANLLLRRRIESRLGGNVISVEDTIENQGGASTPYQILYHCNFGFPLLGPESELWTDSRVQPRDEEARKGLDNYHRFEPPQDSYREQVFYHFPRGDAEGYGRAALINKPLGLGAYVRFRLAELPRLIEWKMMQRGMYVLGLEPANCWVEGRARDRERGILRFLEPGERVDLRLEIGILPDVAAIAAYEAAARQAQSI